MFAVKFADRIFLQQLVELKAQVRLNTEMMQNMTRMIEDLVRSAAVAGTSAKGSTPKLPAKTSLPLQTLEQVHQLEQILSQPAEKQKLVIMHSACCFHLHTSNCLARATF